MSNPKKRLRHPYHLKRLYVSWHWRVLRHAHTGRRVHHQHTSYPILALLVLGVGMLMFHTTENTYAETTISAKISNPTSSIQPHDNDQTVASGGYGQLIASIVTAFGGLIAVVGIFWLVELHHAGVILVGFRARKHRAKS